MIGRWFRKDKKRARKEPLPRRGGGWDSGEYRGGQMPRLTPEFAGPQVKVKTEPPKQD